MTSDDAISLLTEDVRMFGRVALAGVMIGLVALPGGTEAQSTPTTAKGERWIAYSTTAQAITGDVTFAPDRITFENGKFLELTRIGALSQFAGMFGKHPATLYKVNKPDAPVLLRGNRLCGGAKTPTPVTFIVVTDTKLDMIGPDRGFAAFISDEVPTGEKDTCATYNYFIPEKR